MSTSGPASTKLPKHLPKRCKNAHRKESRKASWLRGEQKKIRNRNEQREREELNKIRETTPWQDAKAKRNLKRRLDDINSIM